MTINVPIGRRGKAEGDDAVSCLASVASASEVGLEFQKDARRSRTTSARIVCIGRGEVELSLMQ